MKNNSYLLFMALFVSFSVFAAENIESDGDQLLLASCQTLTMTPEQLNARPCIYFIQGFLAAAQTIDPPIINQQTKKERKRYGFMSRPYRHREQSPPARIFPFYVPENESEAHVIRIVSKQLTPQIDTTKTLRNIIFKALKAEYPCSKA